MYYIYTQTFTQTYTPTVAKLLASAESGVLCVFNLEMDRPRMRIPGTKRLSEMKEKEKKRGLSRAVEIGQRAFRLCRAAMRYSCSRLYTAWRSAKYEHIN